MGITASGVGSGLDINGLVSQLVAAESRPMAALKTQKKTYNAKLSAYGQLSSSLASFQDALKTLSGSGLSAYAASTTATQFSTSAGSAASSGNYVIDISRLAQAHKLCSPGYASSSTSLGSGTLSISVGGAAPILLDPASNSLQDLCDAVNASNSGATASIISDGSANGKRLAVSASQTGVASSITLSGTDDLAAFSYDPAVPLQFGYDVLNNPPTVMSRTQAAQNAELTIDGLKVTSVSNTITDAIKGVTLNLTQTTTTPVSLAVTRDSASVKTAINTFVKAYNDLKSTAGSLTAWGEAGKSGGTLKGDSGPMSMVSQLRSEMSKAVSGAGVFDTLSDIGLSFQKDATLTVSDSKLQAALDTGSADLKKLFNAADGIATRISDRLVNVMGDNGIITTRTIGIKANLHSLDRRSESMQARLDAVEQRYRKQFTALDAALSRMQNTSTYLRQQLSALSSNR